MRASHTPRTVLEEISVRTPSSRTLSATLLIQGLRFSDDLTVQVIFFGQAEKTGEVTMNMEASAEGQAPKAKL